MFYCCTQTAINKHLEERVVKKVYCVNAFRMGSSNVSLAATSWACASVALLTVVGAKVENY